MPKKESLSLSKAGPEPVTVDEFVHKEEALSDITMREKAVNFLLIAYGGLLVLTMTIFFLQGFHVGGFQLESSLLHWLGGATVGEVAGLAATVYGALFKK